VTQINEERMNVTPEMRGATIGSNAKTKWERVAEMPEFQELLAAKLRFVIPACIFFVLYFFALPVLVGFAPSLMATKVIGPVNIAYLFALSQFAMAWTIAWLYARTARKFDAMAQRIVERIRAEGHQA
jgi:uncharacterized membrane protein (DUF485 family)